MFIAILDLRTTPANRAAALAQLDGERDEVRAMPGNLAFRVYAAREDEHPSPSSTSGTTWRRSPATSHLMRSPARARCSGR